MNDELFGTLEYEYGWRGTYAYSIFGKTYPVALVIPCEEDDEIEPAQREAFKRFELEKGRLTDIAARAIYDHYGEIADEVRERVGPDLAETMAPAISGVEDLARIVTPTEVLIQQAFGEDERVVGLLFDCVWDPNLGLAVKFEDEALAGVGTQDIVL